MSLPYTNEDIVRARRAHARTSIRNIRNNIHEYCRNLAESTKNAAKLLYASVASCMHGIFPSTCKYTPLSVCLSIVEHDLIHNNVPKMRAETALSHLHHV